MAGDIFWCCLLFIFNDFSQTNYLKIYRTDLRQIFRIGIIIIIIIIQRAMYRS